MIHRELARLRARAVSKHRKVSKFRQSGAAGVTLPVQEVATVDVDSPPPSHPQATRRSTAGATERWLRRRVEFSVFLPVEDGASVVRRNIESEGLSSLSAGIPPSVIAVGGASALRDAVNDDARSNGNAAAFSRCATLLQRCSRSACWSQALCVTSVRYMQLAHFRRCEPERWMRAWSSLGADHGSVPWPVLEGTSRVLRALSRDQPTNTQLAATAVESEGTIARLRSESAQHGMAVSALLGAARWDAALCSILLTDNSETAADRGRRTAIAEYCLDVMLNHSANAPVSREHLQLVAVQLREHPSLAAIVAHSRIVTPPHRRSALLDELWSLVKRPFSEQLSRGVRSVQSLLLSKVVSEIEAHLYALVIQQPLDHWKSGPRAPLTELAGAAASPPAERLSICPSVISDTVAPACGILSDCSAWRGDEQSSASWHAVQALLLGEWSAASIGAATRGEIDGSENAATGRHGDTIARCLLEQLARVLVMKFHPMSTPLPAPHTPQHGALQILAEAWFGSVGATKMQRLVDCAASIVFRVGSREIAAEGWQLALRLAAHPDNGGSVLAINSALLRSSLPACRAIVAAAFDSWATAAVVFAASVTSGPTASFPPFLSAALSERAMWRAAMAVCPPAEANATLKRILATVLRDHSFVDVWRLAVSLVAETSRRGVRLTVHTLSYLLAALDHRETPQGVSVDISVQMKKRPKHNRDAEVVHLLLGAARAVLRPSPRGPIHDREDAPALAAARAATINAILTNVHHLGQSSSGALRRALLASADAGDWQSTLFLVSSASAKLPSFVPSPEVIWRVSRLLEKSGQRARIDAVRQFAADRGVQQFLQCTGDWCQMDSEPSVTSLASRARLMAEQGRWHSAVSILSMLPQHTTNAAARDTSSAAVACVRVCAERGRWTPALRVIGAFSVVSAVAADRATVRLLLKALAMAAQWRFAVSLFSYAFAAASVHDAVPRSIAFVAVMKACRVASAWQAALALHSAAVTQLTPSPVTFSSVSEVVSVCSMAGFPVVKIQLWLNVPGSPPRHRSTPCTANRRNRSRRRPRMMLRVMATLLQALRLRLRLRCRRRPVRQKHLGRLVCSS